MMDNKHMAGLTDKPIENNKEDNFGVEKYINGLSNFILECSTPMTIAIQGDWGSGKTSIMYMIKEKLGEAVIPVWFNTWQFSQFNMEDQLAVSFLSCLLEKISINVVISKETKKSIQLLKKLAILSGKIGSAFCEIRGAQNIAEDLRAFIDDKFGDKETLDAQHVIENLKEQFQNTINAMVKDGDKRVVLFIDDLDRLQPARAVELLEVLKIFLDCENCVFLLAIDYDVVLQGIDQKYGHTLSTGKGKNFFDKIIQVPFKMPVAHYDISNYVKKSFEQLRLNVEDEKPYVELIKYSVGYNPRAMKRVFNAFLLLTKVYNDEKLNEDYERQLLFAALCLQLSFEKVYNFIVEKGDELDTEFFEQLSDVKIISLGLNNTDSDEDSDLNFNVKELLKELGDEDSINNISNIDDLVLFMTSFKSVLENNETDMFQENIKNFLHILNMTSVTSSIVEKSNGKIGKSVRNRYLVEDYSSLKPNDVKISLDTTLDDFRHMFLKKEFCLWIRGLREDKKKYSIPKQIFDYVMASALEGCDKKVEIDSYRWNYCVYVMQDSLDMNNIKMGAGHFTWSSNVRKATNLGGSGKLGPYSIIFENLPGTLTLGELQQKYMDDPNEGFITKNNEAAIRTIEVLIENSN